MEVVQKKVEVGLIRWLTMSLPSGVVELAEREVGTPQVGLTSVLTGCASGMQSLKDISAA